MIRRPPISTRPFSSAASDVYKRQLPPFSPSLISLMVFVDVKHHVYLQHWLSTPVCLCVCHWSVCIFVCPIACLSATMSVHSSVRLSVCLPNHLCLLLSLFIPLSASMSVRSSICLFGCQHLCLNLCLSNRMPLCQFTCPCLFVFPAVCA